MSYTLLVILAIILLILLSAFFSSAEMAFVSLNRARILRESKKGNRNAKILEELLEKPEHVIGAILIGNNIVNVLASILAGVLAVNIFGNVGIGIATAVMTLLVIVFGEAIPKTFGIYNEKFALKIAKILFILTKVFYPVAQAFSVVSNAIVKALGKEKARMVVTEEEIKAMLDLGVKHGTIKRDEKELIEEVFVFDKTKAIDVYVPKKRMICVEENENVSKVIDLAIRTGHSRFPVYKDNLDNIVGMVHVKDAIAVPKDVKISEIKREILKISAKERIDDVLRKMQKKAVHMAVIEEGGKVLGLVTLEDLIERLVGRIEDEHDKRKPFRFLSKLRRKNKKSKAR